MWGVGSYAGEAHSTRARPGRHSSIFGLQTPSEGRIRAGGNRPLPRWIIFSSVEIRDWSRYAWWVHTLRRGPYSGNCLTFQSAPSYPRVRSGSDTKVESAGKRVRLDGCDIYCVSVHGGYTRCPHHAVLSSLPGNNQHSMPECLNCGAFVTEQYVRVFAPDGMTQPRVCPYCPDKVRDGAEVREAQGIRRG